MPGDVLRSRVAACENESTIYGRFPYSVFPERREAAEKSMTEQWRPKTVQATVAGYWLAELTVPEPS